MTASFCIRTQFSAYGKLSSCNEFDTTYAEGSDFPSRTVQSQLRYSGGDTPSSGTVYTTVYRYEGENSTENAALTALLLELAGRKS